ncbi:hypothetical protein F5Y03DRAFT_375901 [Xylaria venustula]|nr:hypothetical protein F5Y03DRAFT_375901 [Xylaria venustula]
MASFALIGLTSNVLQFAQLGAQLVLEARELYRSTSGLTVSNARVETDTEDLKSLMEQIRINSSVADAAGMTTAERQLLESATSCVNIADKLLKLLEASKAKASRNPRLRAIKQAFYSESTREQVTQLQKRLQELQAATMLRFVTVLRDDQSTLCKSITDLTLSNQKLEANTTNKLDSLHHDLTQTQSRAEEDVKRMTNLICTMRSETADVYKKQKILKSLLFPEIDVRHESIKAAHARTFQWILYEHDFANWLEEGEGLYWIRGKAGSGKSTLMRFLVENPKTLTMLSTWAKNRRLISASHFFWKAGTPMQKSRTGLLRTLLFQILRQVPDLIEKLSPDRWKDEDNNLDTWSENELYQAIRVLPLVDSLPVRFCFFIDGLDEYTTGTDRYHGDYQELIDLLEALSTSSVIKICVSSRPWTPFERAFGSSLNKLRLEDLTKNDISEYVLDKFRGSPNFQRLASVDHRCGTFSKQIVQKAQGVFLWVFLVIESLLKGVSAADDFDDLQTRLDSIPADLEEYFKHMLETIEPIYLEQTTRIFQLTVDAEQPLPLLGYELLDRERQTPDYALRLSRDEASALNTKEIQIRTKIRLNARCRDLLEVVRNPHRSARPSFMSSRVEFLHRTVRDFFVESDVLVDMIKARKMKFDSQISLCRIMLGLVKVYVTRSNPEHIPHTFDLVANLMHYVRLVEIDFIGSKRPVSESKANRRINIAHGLLDEVDRFNAEAIPNQGIHWMNISEGTRGMREYLKKTFLASAIEARLLLYVAAQLDANPEYIHQKRGRPLLDYALCARSYGDLNVHDEPDFALVELLLSKGADPNRPISMYDGKTPWVLFLERLAEGAYFQDQDIVGNPEFYETLHLLISKGADWKQLYSHRRSGVVDHSGGKGDFMGPILLGLTDRDIVRLNALLKLRKEESARVSWLSRLWGRKGYPDQKPDVLDFSIYE